MKTGPDQQTGDKPTVPDLAKLSPSALWAAMTTGTEEWGRRASVYEHALYAEPLGDDRRRLRKCRCGCGGKATHGAFANGIVMSEGCELQVRRFIRHNGTY